MSDKVYNRLKFVGVTSNGHTFNYEYRNMSSTRNEPPPYSTTIHCSANMAMLLGYNEDTSTWEMVTEKNRYGDKWLDGCDTFKELSDKIHSRESSLMAKAIITGSVEREVDKKATEIIKDYFG